MEPVGSLTATPTRRSPRSIPRTRISLYVLVQIDYYSTSKSLAEYIPEWAPDALAKFGRAQSGLSRIPKRAMWNG